MKLLPHMRAIPAADRAAYDFWFTLQCHLGPVPAIVERKEEVRRRVVQRLQQQGPRDPLPVDRVRGISPEEFKRRYFLPGIPVLVEGAAKDWACSKRWTFDFLREHCGHERIKITQFKGLGLEPRKGDREFSDEMLFEEFIDQLLNQGKTYLRFSSLLEAFPELIQDLDLQYLKKMRCTRSGAWVQTFIGGKGTKTLFHNAITEAIFINVQGRKRWQLVPAHYNAVMNPSPEPAEYNHCAVQAFEPDLEAFPAYDCIDRFEVVTEPGDLLFFPAWMWHYVENLDHTIGVRYGWASLRAALTGSPTFTYIRAFAARPSLLSTAWTTYVKRDIRAREEKLLAPAVIRD